MVNSKVHVRGRNRLKLTQNLTVSEEIISSVPFQQAPVFGCIVIALAKDAMEKRIVATFKTKDNIGLMSVTASQQKRKFCEMITKVGCFASEWDFK